MKDDAELLAQQIAYYRARASEYDDWFLCRGRYDKGREHAERWAREVEVVRRELNQVDLGETVLEVAPGTGWWTKELTKRATSVTAVDSAREVLEINRERVGDESVEYVVADIFEWTPTRQYDSVFFSFWLSHVPPNRFEEFWSLVARCLRPGGTVFFVDSRRHAQYQWADGRRTLRGPGFPEHRVTRELGDGRRFDIVKVFYDPQVLRARLNGLGWTGEVSQTSEFFLWGTFKAGELAEAV